MSDVKIFSADGHAPEGDMFSQYIDKAFRFRAPRIETRERADKMEDFYILEGLPPIPVPEGDRAAKRLEPGADDVNTSFRGWDPNERLKDQDVDSVVGEVIHTNNLGFRLFWLTDAALQRACFRAYNDWLAEYCSPDPNRLVGVPLVPVYDINEGIAELERTNKRNLRGAMIPLSPPATCPPYTATVYDPLWAALQELDTPVILHGITGGGYETPLSPAAWWRDDFTLGMVIRPHEAQRVLAQLILSGVFERFPRLKVICAENGTDWIPWYVGRLERAARGPFSFPTKLSLKPIEYFRRNVYFTYIDEPHVVRDHQLLGEDKLMFATDYPHRQSIWPDSMKVADRDTSALPAHLRHALIHDNAMQAFNMPSPVLV